MKFHVANMTCAGCVRTVAALIRSLDTDAVVRSDLRGPFVDIETTTTRAAIEMALAEAHYPAHFVAEAKIGA